LLIQSLEKIDLVIIRLAYAGEIVVLGKVQGVRAAYLHARTAEAAFGEIQLEFRDGFLLLALSLDAIDHDAIAWTGFLTSFASDTKRFSGGGIAYEEDVPAVTLWHLQGFARIMDGDLGFEELLKRNSHAYEKADESTEEIAKGMFHGSSEFQHPGGQEEGAQ
jgi:hypothetical protein